MITDLFLPTPPYSPPPKSPDSCKQREILGVHWSNHPPKLDSLCLQTLSWKRHVITDSSPGRKVLLESSLVWTESGLQDPGQAQSITHSLSGWAHSRHRTLKLQRDAQNNPDPQGACHLETPASRIPGWIAGDLLWPCMTWIWSLSPLLTNRLQFTSVPPRVWPRTSFLTHGLASTGHVDYHTPVLDTTFPLAADKIALFGGHITWLMPASINPPSFPQPLTPTLGLLDSKPCKYLCPSYWDSAHQPISSFMIKTHTCCPFLF